MPAKDLTPSQKEDALRLKALFKAWQDQCKHSGNPWSQEYAASILEFNQSSTSQYLNGTIPLNIDAARKFAALIGCKISDFSPTISAELAKYWPFPDAELLSKVERLSEHNKIELQAVLAKFLIDRGMYSLPSQPSGEFTSSGPGHTPLMAAAA